MTAKYLREYTHFLDCLLLAVRGIDCYGLCADETHCIVEQLFAEKYYG